MMRPPSPAPWHRRFSNIPTNQYPHQRIATSAPGMYNYISRAQSPRPEHSNEDAGLHLLMISPAIRLICMWEHVAVCGTRDRAVSTPFSKIVGVPYNILLINLRPSVRQTIIGWEQPRFMPVLMLPKVICLAPPVVKWPGCVSASTNGPYSTNPATLLFEDAGWLRERGLPG